MKPIPCTDQALEYQYTASLLAGSPGAVSARIDPADIFTATLQVVLTAIGYCERQAGKWSYLDVKECLENGGDLGKIGGDEYLIKLEEAGNAAPLLDGRPVVQRLQKLARARSQRARTMSALAAFDENRFDQAEEHLRSASDATENDRDCHYETAKESVWYAYNELVKKAEGKSTLVKTGVHLMDKYMGGLMPGSMTVIGGRTGDGKSSMALLMAVRMHQRGERVGIINLEDNRDVSGSRLLAHLSNVPAWWMYTADTLPDHKKQQVFDKAPIGADKATGMQIEFAYAIGAKAETVYEAARELVSRRGCTVLIVDYVQAVRVDLRVSRYDKAVSEVAKVLKGMCSPPRLNVPLVLLSQLKRPKENPFRPPYLNDLKESGDIENEAEAVWLLWRDSDDDDADTHCKLAKLKWGPGGACCDLKRHPEHGMISDLVEKEEKAEEMRDYGGLYND